MQSTDVRNQFDLHRAKILIAALLVLLVAAPPRSAAQQFGSGSYNFLDFQTKPFYFGLTLGFNSSRFTPFRSDEFIFNDTYSIVESLEGPGFNLAIVTNLKIGQHFDFRFLPGFSFAERKLIYHPSSRLGKESQRQVGSVFVDMPFHFRYKSAPYKDKRLFVIAGLKYSFDVASESRAKQAEELVKISPHDFAVEYGAGIQFFLPYFIFSPELKVSHGIGNTLIFNPNLEESTVLEKVLSRTFTISLHFEG